MSFDIKKGMSLTQQHQFVAHLHKWLTKRL